MCGIFGFIGESPVSILELISSNLWRGWSNYGECRIDESNVQIIKQATISFDQIINGDNGFYMGHLRAPTGPQTTTKEDIHPFVRGKFIVAHNGTIKNNEPNKIDSALIPEFLNNLPEDADIGNQLKVFFDEKCPHSTACCWVLSVDKMVETYLVKKSNSLFFNEEFNAFSSAKIKGKIDVASKDNVIYQFQNGKFEIIAELNSASSDYFIAN